jgi:D-alanyl-D-alanine carboxypeptidase (penicillin-binding protein 5/6)
MLPRRRWIALITVLGILFSIVPLSHVKAAPFISAQGAAVIDVDSGRILYDKNGQQKMRVASLTKIMTAIVAIEEADVNEMVTISDHAIGVEGSSIYLRHGEKLTLEQLLYGLMLRSGNDAAVAIAHHVGGSLEGFSHLMNEKAEHIGLSGTRFANPHGLDDSNQHFSTAVDMAKLTAYALHNELFKKIVSTPIKKIPQHGEKWDRKLINKNKMLHLYQGADGVKTGYTRLAKRCLVSSASRNDRQIAVVTLNAPNDWDDHSRLLDYAFEHFQVKQIVGENERVNQSESDLYTVNSFSYPLASGEDGNIQKKIMMEKSFQEMLPGGVAGYLHIYLGEKGIGKIGLIYKDSKESIGRRTIHSSQNFMNLLKALIWGGW